LISHAMVRVVSRREGRIGPIVILLVFRMSSGC